MPSSSLHLSTPAIGSLLGGRWTVLDALQGAMGTVFMLQDPASGARLAAKTPRLNETLSQELRDRFAIEAGTWLTLGHHPNVVEALFFEELELDDALRPFLFLEWVDGPTLKTVLQHEKRLALPVVLDLATGIARGMAYAHGEGRPGVRIVHRDLKPDNVFITQKRIVKVSDFGIARALDRPSDVVAEGLGAGTPFYAAPEQMKDARAADRRSDIYSFGALVYELLTGRPPFLGPTLSELVLAILGRPPPPLRDLRPDVPPEFAALLHACLEKQPKDRPDRFGDVLLRVSEIRENDRLWTSTSGGGSCPVCGWMSERRSGACVICSGRLGPGMRYAPVSPRSLAGSPTLGRAEGDSTIHVAAVEVRPRVPRAGDEVVLTVLLENPGRDPVDGVGVPYALPDRDAFSRVREEQKSFVGSVPPTAPGAPIRISWSVVPLRAGTFTLRAPGVVYRTAEGRRRVERGTDVTIQVQPALSDSLVGRADEQAKLRVALHATQAGSARLTALLGPPGLGKTSLTRQVWEAAGPMGFARARGRCLDRGVEMRGALKEAARQALGLAARERAPGLVAAAVSELLGDGAAARGNLVRLVVGELLARPVARGESPAGIWAQFFVALAQVKPLLLALEDVQRDPEVGDIALQIVRHARRAHAPVLVVLSGRLGATGVGFINRLHEEEVANDGVQVLTLEPLTGSDTADLFEREFAPNDFERSAPWLPEAVWRLTGGNPLLLRELVRSLHAESGPGSELLVTRDGRWTASAELTEEGLRESLPASVDDVLLARFGEYGEETRAFLRAAAVLGDVFEVAVLRDLLGDPPSFDASLSELEQALILRERSGSPPRLRFHEPLVPELLDRAIRAADPAEHVRLHGAAADALNLRQGARLRNALRLGRHLAAAGRTAEAVKALIEAVQRLVDGQAYRRARSIVEDIMQMLASGAHVGRRRMTRLWMLQGEVLRFTGDLNGALEAYGKVLTQAHRGTEAGGLLATVYSKKGRVHETLGQLDDALYCYAVGLSMREQHGLDADVPMSLANLGGLHLLRGDALRAEDYLQRALRAAKSHDASRGESVARVLSARLQLSRGDASAARRELRLALRAARSTRNKRVTAQAWRVLGRIALREGRLQAARTHLQTALRVHMEVGDRIGQAELQLDLSAVFEIAGDDAAALQAIARAMDAAERLGLDRLAGTAGLSRGRLELAAGRPRAARETLRAALACRERVGETAGRAECRALLASAERFLGADDAARTLLEAAGEDARALGDVDAQAFVLIARSDALSAWGDRPGALAAVREGRELGGLAADHALALEIRRAELTDDLPAAEAVALSARDSTNARALARALASLGFVALRLGEDATAASALRRAAGILRQRGTRDPLLLAVLRASAQAQAAHDPAAGEAASRRAAEVETEMVGRGYVPGICRGFLLE